MADPLQTSVAVPPRVSPAYRPLSVLAIAGAVLALGSFVVWIGYTQSWVAWFLVAVPALVVSIFAARIIRRSEGAVAGLWIANLAIFLSLINAVGWPVMYFTVNAIVVMEAQEIADHFFDRLKAGDGPGAFIDTKRHRKESYSPAELEPKSLRVNNPGEIGNEYDNFRHNLVAGTILRFPEDAEVQPLGVQDWDYKDQQYRVALRYRIKTKELDGEAVIVLYSYLIRDAAERSRRQWHVSIHDCKFVKELKDIVTEFGHKLNERAQHLPPLIAAFFNEGIGSDDLNRALLLCDPTKISRDHPGLQAIYREVREGTPPGGYPKELGVSPRFMLLGATRRGDDWTIDIQNVARTANSEITFQMTFEYSSKVQVRDARSIESAYRITDVRFIHKSMRLEPLEQ